MCSFGDRIHNVGIRHNDILYNSYLLKGEKTALLDVVCDNAADASIERICSLTSLKDIDYIVINHVMPDRTKVIDRIIKDNPDVTVIGTIAAIRNLKEIMNISFKERAARDFEVLELGLLSLKFIITPNLEWPDSMMTYCQEEKTLFSSVAFGSFEDETAFGMESYFNDILLLNKAFVRLALSRISGLDINVILPYMGYSVKDIEAVFSLYKKLSEEEAVSCKNIAIIYSSRYGSNKALASAAKDEALLMGYEAKLICADTTAPEMIQKEIEGAVAVMFGVPTYNRNCPKSIWDAVSAINAEKVRSKSFALFSSYGWSGEGVGNIHAILKAMRLEIEPKPFSVLFTPDSEAIKGMKEYTRNFLTKLQEN